MKNKKQLLLLFLLGMIVFTGINSSLAFFRLSFEKIHVLIDSDGLGYYIYLPSFFIEHDVLHQWFAMRLENGYFLNKYTCGVAILETPFFLIADLISTLFDLDKKSGRSAVYMLSMALSASVYLYLALYTLFFYLKNIFDKKTAWYCIGILYLATNIYYYSVIEPGMSHVYSFFCFTMCLHFTDKYYKNQNIRSVMAFSFFFGLATLIRPTNILLILLFLFYEVYSIEELKRRIASHLKKYYIFIIMIGVSLIVAFPQMLYWYYTTGKPIVFSYGYNHESFSNWKSPKIIEVLIGHKSGWLTHTPIMLLSLIGLIISIKMRKVSAPIIIIIFGLTLWICASWWAYTFGCSFGYRSFVEYYVLLILPTALLVFKILNGNSKFLILVFLLLTAILIYLNIQMTYLYIKAGCWDGPDWHWSDYFNILKLSFNTD